MAAVTVSRQPGNGGEEVGRSVTTTLEHRCIDKVIIEAILTEYGLAQFEKI